MAAAKDAQVRVYGDEKRDDKDAFVFRIPGVPDLDVPDSPTITVHEPDGGTVMDILDPQTSIRRALRLYIGATQWDQIEEYVDRLKWEDCVGLLQDIGLHFGIDKPLTTEVNREERRQRRTGRARRR